MSNDDPLLRIRAFIPLPAENRTLAEAVAAAGGDSSQNDSPASAVTVMVYRSDSGNAVAEVSRGEPFKTAGYYKEALVEAGAAGRRAAGRPAGPTRRRGRIARGFHTKGVFDGEEACGG